MRSSAYGYKFPTYFLHYACHQPQNRSPLKAQGTSSTASLLLFPVRNLSFYVMLASLSPTAFISTIKEEGVVTFSLSMVIHFARWNRITMDQWQAVPSIRL